MPMSSSRQKICSGHIVVPEAMRTASANPIEKWSDEVFSFRISLFFEYVPSIALALPYYSRGTA